MGEQDEFGKFPDVDSNVAPSDLQAWSIAPSASAQAKADLETQINLRRLAEQREREIQARCNALQAKLDSQTASKKRKADEHDLQNDTEHAAAAVVPPRKKASPGQPLKDTLATQPPPLTQHSEDSDDEVPITGRVRSQAANIRRLKLNPM